MGFNPFKSETKVTVATTVARMIEDDKLPDAVKTGLIAGLFDENRGQLTEHIMEELTQCIGVKAERMFNYGKDKYIYGNPSSKILLSNAGVNVVKYVLSEQEGAPVTLEYARYGALNNLHYGWVTLQQQYGYNPITNEIGFLKQFTGFTTYLEDLQVVVKKASLAELDNGSLEQWGIPPTAGYTPKRPMQTWILWQTAIHTPYAIEWGAAADYFRVKYCWLDTTTGKKHTGKVNFPMSAEDPNQGYYQAKYSYTTSAGKFIKYWTYLEDTGTYPVLDNLFSTEHNEFGTFFPMAYFRLNKKSTAKDPTTAEYKSTKKLLKYLGIDYAEMAEAIDENPDIDDVKTAMMMMGVPADSENPMDQRYLYDFFEALYLKTGGGSFTNYAQNENLDTLKTLGFRNAAGVLAGGIPQAALVIQDAKFKMTINTDGIYHRKVVGSIGAVGTYAFAYKKHPKESQIISYASATDAVGIAEIMTTLRPCHYYRKQITEHVYDEIAVYNLAASYHVWGKYMASANDDEKNNLLIPLDRSITTEYSSMDREELYARSLHYMFHSLYKTKIKWYQTGFFKFLLMVVAVVITVFSMGGVAGVAAAISAMTASATALLMAILKGVLFKLAFTLFVKLVGPEVAMLFSILAVCYVVYSGLTSTGGVPGAPWAKELLQVSAGLIDAVNTSITDALADIQKEFTELVTSYKEKSEFLENTNKLLETNTFLQPFMFFGETPDDYYNRTCHAGNIGVLGVSAISNYVDYSLTLPSISDTLQRRW